MRNIRELIWDIEASREDNVFFELYRAKTAADKAKDRYLGLLRNFESIFGELMVEVYSAPGRSEICGNHTDHQGGKVLACSVDLDAVCVVARRDDNIIEIVSEGYDIKKVSLDDLSACESEYETTHALIKGVAAGLKMNGFRVGGFSAYMNSTVLGGSGLSSSAAFEVLIGNVLSGLYNEMSVSPVDIARIGQFAENVYFGKPCGLMDQMASSVGGFVYIDFADRSAPRFSKIDFDFDGSDHSLCIVDTGGSHEDLTDDYASVPIELKQVCEFWGKDLLRECDEDKFYESLKELRGTVGDRALLRAIHIFQENRRVDDIVGALMEKDFEKFKSQIVRSGQSSFMYLQNVYSIKNFKEQGLSLGLALSERILDGRGAWRVHGGGFAGTILTFVPNSLVNEYKAELEKVFGEGSCYCLSVRSIGGTRVF